MRRSTVCTRKFQPPRLSVNSSHLSLHNNSTIDDNNSKIINVKINEPMKLSTSSSPLRHKVQVENKQMVTKRDRPSSSSHHVANESNKENENCSTSAKKIKTARKENKANIDNHLSTSHHSNGEKEEHMEQQKEDYNDEKLLKENNEANNANKRLLFLVDSITKEHAENESSGDNEEEEEHIALSSLHHLQHAWQVNTVRPNQSREAVHRVVYYPPLKPPSTLSTPIDSTNLINNAALPQPSEINGLGTKLDSNESSINGHSMYYANLSSENMMQVQGNIAITEVTLTQTENNTKTSQIANSDGNTVISKQNTVISPEHSSTSPATEMYGKSGNLVQASLSPFAEMEGISQHTEFLRALEFQQQRQFEREQHCDTLLQVDEQVRVNNSNNNTNSSNDINESMLIYMQEKEKNSVIQLKQTSITTSDVEEANKPENNYDAMINEEQEYHNNNSDVSGAIRQLFRDSIDNTITMNNTPSEGEQTEMLKTLEQPLEYEEQELIEDEEMLERELEEDIRLSTDIAFTPTTTTVNMIGEMNASTNYACCSNNNNTCPLALEPILEENTNYCNENEENAIGGAVVNTNVQVEHMIENNTFLAEDEKSISLCQETNLINTKTSNDMSHQDQINNNASCDQVYPMFLPPSQQTPVPGQNTRTRTVFRFKSNSMSTTEEEHKNNISNADHMEEAAMTNTSTTISTVTLPTDGRPKRTLFVFKTRNDKEVDAAINTKSSSDITNNNQDNDNKENVASIVKEDKDNINIHVQSNINYYNREIEEIKKVAHLENDEKDENCESDTTEVTTTSAIDTKEDILYEEEHKREEEEEEKEEENEERIVTTEEHTHEESTECIDDKDKDNDVEENTFYDLPSNVGVLFATHRGVHKLYPWQHNVLTRPDIRRGFNFVYSMPTSGGKTLVAEIALLRCVLLRHKSCMFVLPYVSLAEEKTIALQPFAEAFDFSVDGHYGMTGHFPLPKSPALFVCTIEKANSVLNYLIEENLSDDLGAVVVDELHMLRESRRGAILELFLSKLLVLHDKRNENTFNIKSKGDIVMNGHDTKKLMLEEKPHEEHNTLVQKHNTIKMKSSNESTKTTPLINPLQIIGMSATVPNLNEIAHWLHASFYEGHLRPVPLHQYSVVEGMVLRDGTHNERNLNGSTEAERLFELVTEVNEASVLIFCASRMQCVETAKAIVRYQRQLLTRSASVAIQDHLRNSAHNNNTNNKNAKPMGMHNETSNSDEASLALLAHESPELVEALRSLPPLAAHAIEGLLSELYSFSHTEASQLAEVVPFGVAFHHGGLLAEERELIERAYRQRYIRVLCCTSTLAAGVNLPARRVIFKTPYMGKEFLNKSRYLQMCGRAGRAGWDAFGESFLLLSRRDRQRGHRLMHQELEKCESQMLEDAESFARALLECIGVKLITSLHSAQQWITHLFCYYAPGPVDGNLIVTQSEKAPSHYEDYQIVFDNNIGRSSSGSKVELNHEVCEETMKLMAHALHYALRLLLKSGLVKQKRVAIATTEEEQKEKENIVKRVHDNIEGETAQVNLIHTTTEKEAKPFLCLASDEDSNTFIGAHKMIEAEIIGESTIINTSNQNIHKNKKTEVLLEVTAFGASSVRSCFSIEEAIAVREELEQLRENGLILADDLHLCYFLTPLREVGKCDWGLYRVLLSRLSDTRQAIANMIGVNEYLIDQRAMGLGGNSNSNSNSNSFTNANSLGNGSELVNDDIKRQLFIARRFFVALMLADVLAEVPMEEIEPKYNVNRGQLQSLMRSASMFSSSITSFCHAMEWYSLEAVLSSFVKRLDFGVKPDLVPLMEIKGVQPARARALWIAGFRDAASIATCEAEEMVQKVRKANSPDSKAAKFFSKRTALMLVREAHVVLERQIKARKGELQALTNRFARS